jgi:cytochrome P450
MPEAQGTDGKMPGEALDIPRGWGVYALGARADYFALLNRIREDAAVHDAGDGVFLVTRWDAVSAALRDPRLKAGSGVSESFGGGAGPVESVVRNWLMSMNGEAHRRARGLVSRLFQPRALGAMEPRIREICRAMARAFVARAADGPADFASAVATRLPSEVVRILFAIDGAEWDRDVAPLFDSNPPPGRDAFAAVQGLTPYFQDKIRSGVKTGGLIDELSAPDKDGDCLTEAQVIANSVLIVTAAIDTTAGTIGNMLYSLMASPAAQAQVAADRAAIPGAVDETLRHCPSAPSSTRYAAEDVEIGGVHIPAGSNLFFSLAAANRDPRKFADPDRFDIGRDASALLTFGGGAHFCLGAVLARMEARILFEELFAAGRDFALAEPVAWRIDNPTVRAPKRLMVTCARRIGS